MPKPQPHSLRLPGFIVFLLVSAFILNGCIVPSPSTWRIDYQNRTAYHPICTTCLIPFPPGARASGGSPITSQVFGVAVRDMSAVELTAYYADALATDGWEWAANTDPNKSVDPNNSLFIATKDGHAYSVTIGPGAEGTVYSAFMELYPLECPFTYSDATICGYDPGK